MSDSVAEAATTAGSSASTHALDWYTRERVQFAVVAAAAFGLYWFSSFMLETRGATMYFGTDTSGYREFVQGDVFRRMADTYDLDRIIRFHLTTATLAVTWMKILGPLGRWIAPLYLLKALFALVGAIGVRAALSAFAAVMPRRHAILFGAIYAVSFSVWFFSSIQESKIVSGTLASIYIASYLRLREDWTVRGAARLTAIQLFACMNEMVAGFLALIPIVDTLVQRGLDWRQGRWIAAHVLVGPLAFLILEGFAHAFLTPGRHPEGASHFSMFLYYLAQAYHGADMLYLFVLNWLLFAMAAPARDAPLWDPPGFFEPSLMNYLSSPASAALVVVFVGMIGVSIATRRRGQGLGNMAGIVVGLVAFSLVRAAFFFIFDPPEPLLFSSSVTLAHMLLIGMLFAQAEFPGKRTVLATLAVLLATTNQAFIVGW